MDFDVIEVVCFLTRAISVSSSFLYRMFHLVRPVFSGVQFLSLQCHFLLFSYGFVPDIC